MNQIAISDQHLEALKKEAARRPGPSLQPATILSELLDEMLKTKRL